VHPGLRPWEWRVDDAVRLRLQAKADNSDSGSWKTELPVKMRLLQLTSGKTASNLQQQKKQSAACPAPRKGINLSLGKCIARAPLESETASTARNGARKGLE
jgi:hypothetical protein